MNSNQFRKMLSEAIMAREAGDPLFTPPNTQVSRHRLEVAVADLLEAWEEYYLSSFNEDDPSMSNAGHGSWLDQVMSSTSDLEDKLESAMSEVERKLVGGEYSE